MQATTVLRQAAAARQPLIKFMGKRTVPGMLEKEPLGDARGLVLAD